jgi:inner membrane protein
MRRASGQTMPADNTVVVLGRLICERLRDSLLFRLLATGFLVLILQIPVAMIRDLIGERQATRSEAFASVTGTAGGRQTLLGPVLAVPTLETVTDAEGKRQVRRQMRYMLPEQLTIESRPQIEIRRRGIFDVPLFVAGVKLEGRFELGEEVALAAARGRTLQWEQAQLCIGVSDPRAIREAAPLQLGGAALPLAPGANACQFLPAGIHARLSHKPENTVPFAISLVLGGSERLAFVPVGSQTIAQVRSDFPTPSFDGAFLPRERQVDAGGFVASWRVLHLGRNFPAAFDDGEVDRQRLEASAFGASFLQPGDAYRSTDRAVKYQLLFLGLTGLLFFLFELLARCRVHPVQYLLVGLALCLFFLLLLSLAEQLGFGPAYTAAALAVTALVTLYGWSVLGRRRGLALGGMLAALYGLLYVLLQIQDYALLVGSIALFMVLAAVMRLTRRVDWYGRGRGDPAVAAAEAELDLHLQR